MERLAVSGPMGMPKACVTTRVRALAFAQAMSVPRAMGTEREIRRPKSPKMKKAAMLNTFRSRKRLRWMRLTI